MKLFTIVTKPYFVLLLTFLIMLTVGCSSQNKVTSHFASKETSWLLDHVHILDVENGKVLANRQILVDEGKIVGIYAAGNKPSDPSIAVIDGQGQYATPGLIDMHVHAYDKSAFELSLSHGVTHVRIMNGVSQHLDWKKMRESGLWLASDMTVSSPIIKSGESSPFTWTANSRIEGRALVRKAKRAGYDLIKAYGSLSKEALAGVIEEAQTLSLPVAKHGPHPASGMNWQNIQGLQSLEHVEDIYQGPLEFTYDQEKLSTALINLKKVGVPVTPTLNAYWQLMRLSVDKQSFIDAIETDYTSSIVAWEAKNNQVKRWLTSSAEMAEHNRKTYAFLLNITAALQHSDIPILVGSDAGVLLAPHGLATHNELAQLQQAGLSAFDVLKAATLAPAKALGLDNEIGSIEVGLRADLLLTELDPSQQISQLSYPNVVVKDGVWLAKNELNMIRQQAVSSRSWWSEFWVLLTNY